MARIWLLVGDKLGDNAQVAALADKLAVQILDGKLAEGDTVTVDATPEGDLMVG